MFIAVQQRAEGDEQSAQSAEVAGQLRRKVHPNLKRCSARLAASPCRNSRRRDFA
jgi:hypothetical protein